MHRRTFLSLLTLPPVAAGLRPLSAFAQGAHPPEGAADYTIRIGTGLVELAPDTIVSTTTLYLKRCGD
jgi:hypothetical protein